MRRIDLRRVAVVAMLCVASSARAQLPLLVEGIADGELWSTSATSNLLTRNGGDPAGLVRIQLWGAIEPIRHLVFYAQGEVESGSARTTSLDRSYHATAEQYGVRFTASDLFVLDVGKLAPVVGTFAARRFSTRNPLIGSPDGYTLEYPLGAMVSGETKHFDYRAALIDLPASHRNYVPSPSRRLRPAVGAGFTPTTGLRFGGSFTVGPYLNDGLTSAQLAGASWTDYAQRVIALDASFARGYLETRVEAARGSYEVPGRVSPVWGYTYYGEVKYTLSPRFFVAGRAERNKYPFIRANPATWTARLTDFVDGELGAGYRVKANTLVKASVRGDRWWVPENAVGFRGQGGAAVAIQVSQSFDVVSWFRRAQ